MVTCKNCRHKNNDDAAACSNCSMPLHESRIITGTKTASVLHLKNGKTIELKRRETIIGRAGTISFPHDKFMSKTHAKIIAQKNGCTIHDLKSKNGTIINKRKLKAPHPLRSGDTIQIGSTRLTYKKL